MTDPAPNASDDGRNTPVSKAEVYAAADGRPGLLLKRKTLDGDGWEMAMVKAGMVVTGWVSDDELKAGRKWRPVIPAEVAEELEALRRRTNDQSLERDAYNHAMRVAIRMLSPEQAAQVREVFRRSRPATSTK